MHTMNITSINNNYNSNCTKAAFNPNFGNKHIINRYLYHASTKQGYQRILETGMIQPTLDSCGKKQKGVFLFSLENFLRRWVRMYDGTDLRYDLFNHVAPYEDIVLLRIPVKEFDKNLLRFRSINKLSKSMSRGNFEELDKNAHEIIGEPANTIGAKICRDCEPIEYIYTDAIPADIVELVGTADFKNIKIQQIQSTKKRSDVHNNAMRVALNTIFKNQPELNAIKTLCTRQK